MTTALRFYKKAITPAALREGVMQVEAAGK
jgi:hypothetical protein